MIFHRIAEWYLAARISHRARRRPSLERLADPRPLNQWERDESERLLRLLERGESLPPRDHRGEP